MLGGGLGSAIWPRSYGYTPTAAEWQNQEPDNMRAVIHERVCQLEQRYSGNAALRNDYAVAHEVLTASNATPHDFVELLRRSSPVPLDDVLPLGHSHKITALQADQNGMIPFGIAIAADLSRGYEVELDMGNLAQIAHVVGKVGIGIKGARQIMMDCHAARMRRLGLSQDPDQTPPPPRPNL